MWYFQAYNRMHGKVSMSEIKAYVELFKIHRPLEEFVDCIIALDREINPRRVEK